MLKARRKSGEFNLSVVLSETATSMFIRRKYFHKKESENWAIKYNKYIRAPIWEKTEH